VRDSAGHYIAGLLAQEAEEEAASKIDLPFMLILPPRRRRRLKETDKRLPFDQQIRCNDFPEKTAQSAVPGANPNGETPPGTAAGAFLQWSHAIALSWIPVSLDSIIVYTQPGRAGNSSPPRREERQDNLYKTLISRQ
jgi:hypothetical protein